jgi:hypothetical protein
MYIIVVLDVAQPHLTAAVKSTALEKMGANSAASNVLGDVSIS